MNKLISLLLAALMLGMLFAGCGPANNDPVNLLPADDDAAAEETAEIPADEPSIEPADTPADNGTPGSGGTAADSYTAYINAKSAMVTRLTEGLGSNPDTAFASLSLLGVTMVDLALLPASFFGLGQQAVESGMSFFGATGVQYSENGNSYTVTYTDEEGATYTFNGTYDPAADVLTCTALKDGVEYIYSEYHKTSFGYVAQTYATDDDGTTSLYQIAVQGEDGVIGMSTASGKPAALTGGESADFPKACPEWYAVSGTTITGVTSDGKQLNFEYTPVETE